MENNNHELICFRLGKFHEWILNELDKAVVDKDDPENEPSFYQGRKDALCDVLDAFDKKFESLQ